MEKMCGRGKFCFHGKIFGLSDVVSRRLGELRISSVYNFNRIQRGSRGTSNFILLPIFPVS